MPRRVWPVVRACSPVTRPGINAIGLRHRAEANDEATQQEKESVLSGDNEAIKRVALVSHHYRRCVVHGKQTYRDLSEHAARIHRRCDQHGCDTVVYCLHSWSDRSPVQRSHTVMFGGLHHMQRVVIETGEPISVIGPVETWVRSQQQPTTSTQRFGRSAEPPGKKQLLIDELPDRQIGRNGLLLLCGESNVVTMNRGTGEMRDPFGINKRLKRLGIEVILNGLHSYMRRHEMQKKRAYLSRQGRTVLSVWPQGRWDNEARLPWTVWHDGQNRTDAVREVLPPFRDRPDIRIGVVDLSELRRKRT